MPPSREISHEENSGAREQRRQGRARTRRIDARGNATRGRAVDRADREAARRRQDALKTLGTHLGRGAQGSYKEVTTALAALRREATKTNKQALKDFDKLRAAVTHKPAAAKSNSGAKASTAKTSAAKKSSGLGEGELELDKQAHDRQALDRLPRKDHAFEEDQLILNEGQLSGRERRPGVDPRRLVDIELDRAADAHARAEGHIAVHHQPVGLPQRRRRRRESAARTRRSACRSAGRARRTAGGRRARDGSTTKSPPSAYTSERSTSRSSVVLTGANRVRGTQQQLGPGEALDRRAHRALELDHRRRARVARVDRLAVDDQRQLEHAVGARRACPPAPADRPTGCWCCSSASGDSRGTTPRPRAASAPSRAGPGARRPAGARRGRPCDRPRSPPRPPSGTGSPRARGTRRSAGRRSRRGCRRWRSSRSRTRAPAARRASPSGAARRRRRRDRAGTTPARIGRPADGRECSASSFGTMLCRKCDRQAVVEVRDGRRALQRSARVASLSISTSGSRTE